MRVWRVVRLLNSVIGGIEEAHEQTKLLLIDEKQRVEEGTQEHTRLEAALEREVDAKARVEDMLRSYKEEVDTLREALHIAARTVAESQGYPSDAFSGGGGEDAMQSTERAELDDVLRGAAASVGGGSGARRGNGGAGGRSGKQRVVVDEDGSY